MDPGRFRPERRLGVEDRRQLLVLHVDQPARLRRDLLGLGGHGGDLVTDAADDVSLEGQVVLRVPERVLRDVPARDHAQDARECLRAGRVDPRDAGVRDARPQDLAPDHPRQLEVGEVLDRARHLLHGVELGDARADDAERPGRARARRRAHRRAGAPGTLARPRTTLGAAHASAPRRAHALRGELDGADDLDVAGAAAEVSLETGADLDLARLGRRLEEAGGGHDHPRGAESALGAALLQEPLLDRMEGRRPVIVVASGHASARPGPRWSSPRRRRRRAPG